MPELEIISDWFKCHILFAFPHLGAYRWYRKGITYFILNWTNFFVCVSELTVWTNVVCFSQIVKGLFLFQTVHSRSRANHWMQCLLVYCCYYIHRLHAYINKPIYSFQSKTMLCYTDYRLSQFSVLVLRLEINFYIICTCNVKYGITAIPVWLVQYLEKNEIISKFEGI